MENEQAEKLIREAGYGVSDFCCVGKAEKLIRETTRRDDVH